MKNDKQGINNSMVRQENKKNIKKLLYSEGALTKQEITTRLSLSLPTVNLLVQQLKDEGMISEQTSEVSSGGRKPQLIGLDPDARNAVGVDISKQHFNVVLVNMKSRLLDSRMVQKRFENTDAYWGTVKQSIQDILQGNGISDDRVLGAGLSIPGIVKPESGMIELAPTLGLRKFVYSHISQLLDMPLVVENEANAAGFAEVWLRDVVDNAVYLSITNGVGGTLILENHVFVGKNNRSGEFGHMTLVPDGEECSCGKRGCFEAYCSTSKLTEYSNGDMDAFYRQLKSGDEKITKVWNEYLQHLAVGISNLVMALDTDIIIGGDLDELIRDYRDQLQDMVAEKLLNAEQAPRIRISSIGKNAAAIGAALMLVSDFLES